jgi:Mitochondrial ribosomal protein L37
MVYFASRKYILFLRTYKIITPNIIIQLTTATMICHGCLYRASALRISYFRPPNYLARAIASSAPSPSPSPSSASSPVPSDCTSPAFTSPFPLSRTKARTPLPVSICPAGTSLKGLNFLKGREDPIALPDEDYPEWLWHCLDAKTTDSKGGEQVAGDEFCECLSSILVPCEQLRRPAQDPRNFLDTVDWAQNIIKTHNKLGSIAPNKHLTLSTH